MATSPGQRFVRRHDAARGATANATAADITYDTAVISEGGYSYSAPEVTVDEAGLYLFVYDLGQCDEASTRAVGTLVPSVNTVDQERFRATHRYLRSSGGQEGASIGMAILDLAASDDVKVRNPGVLAPTDSTGNFATRINHGGAMQLIRLPANDFTHVERTVDAAEVGTSNINTTRPWADTDGTWTKITYNSEVNDDAGLYSGSGGDVVLAANKKYMVVWGVTIYSTDASRHTDVVRLSINGDNVQSGSGYQRNTGAQGPPICGMYLHETGGTAETMFLEATHETEGGDAGTPQVSDAYLQVIELPDSAEWIHVDNDNNALHFSDFSTVTTYYDSTLSATFRADGDSNLSLDSVNDAVQNDAGETLPVLAIAWHRFDRDSTASGTRKMPWGRFDNNGTTIGYGIGGAFSRGQQSTDDTWQAHFTSVATMDLVDGGDLKITVNEPAANANSDLGIYAASNRHYFGFQVLNLNTLAAAGPTVHTASGTPTTPAATASGAATIIKSASGTPSIPASTASGAATIIKSASGTPTISAATASGAAAVTGSASASGGATTPAIEAAGTAQVRKTASGGATIGAVEGAGAASEPAVFPTFRSTSVIASPGPSDTIVVPKPAGTVDGDIVIVTLYSEPNGQVVTPPAGFTSFEKEDEGTFSWESWWHRADSDGADYTFTATGNSWCSGTAVTYTNCVESGDPINVSSKNSGFSSTWLGTGITTTVDNCTLLFRAQNQNSEFNNSPPSGMTERQDEAQGYLADEERATAGATGDRSASLIGTFRWAVHMIALLPPSAGPTASGGATTGAVEAAGTAKIRKTSTGAATLGASVAAGLVAFQGIDVAVGDATLPSISAAGTAKIIKSASGGATFGAIEAAGTASEPLTAQFYYPGTLGQGENDFFDAATTFAWQSDNFIYGAEITGVPAGTITKIGVVCQEGGTSAGTVKISVYDSNDDLVVTDSFAIAQSQTQQWRDVDISQAIVAGDYKVMVSASQPDIYWLADLAENSVSRAGTFATEPQDPLGTLTTETRLFGVRMEVGSASNPSASGTPSIPAATASGAATVRKTASGAATIAAIIAAGAASVITDANGAADIPVIEAAGVAQVIKTANGAATLGAIEANGAANVTGFTSASGSPDIPSASASGSVDLIRNATDGNPAIAALEASGTASIVKSALGGAEIGVITASGAVDLIRNANGAATLGAIEATGTATAQGISGASGNADVTPPVLAGTVDLTRNANGDATLSAIEAAGIASITAIQTASGNPQIPTIEAVGAAGLRYTASDGAPVIGSVTASGAVDLIRNANGNADVPLPIAFGSAIEGIVIASGAAQTPIIESAGNATVLKAASGAATITSLEAVGNAVIRKTATGAASIGAPFANGAAEVIFKTNGAANVPTITASGNVVVGGEQIFSETYLLGYVIDGRHIGYHLATVDINGLLVTED